MILSGPYDRVLKCIRCKNEFLFTFEDQQWWAKNRVKDPKKCAKCRWIQKVTIQNNHDRGIYLARKEKRPTYERKDI